MLAYSEIKKGTIIVLETGAKMNVPLFVEQNDIIEVNTETEKYVRRIE